MESGLNIDKIKNLSNFSLPYAGINQIRFKGSGRIVSSQLLKLP